METHKEKFDRWMVELDFWTKQYEELIEMELGIPIKLIPPKHTVKEQ